MTPSLSSALVYPVNTTLTAAVCKQPTRQCTNLEAGHDGRSTRVHSPTS